MKMVWYNSPSPTQVQAQYWHDPLQEELYLSHNVFLPDINNEDGSFNQTYKDNLVSLQNFVMVQFLNDTVVIPRQSEVRDVIHLLHPTPHPPSPLSITAVADDWFSLSPSLSFVSPDEFC
jgi:Ulp1 family protease